MGSYTDTKISKEMIHMRAHIVPQTHKMSSVFLAKKEHHYMGAVQVTAKNSSVHRNRHFFASLNFRSFYPLPKTKKNPQTRAMNCPYPTDILCAFVARQITFLQYFENN